jgi:hypothetical protein
MDHLPTYEFQKCVDRYSGDYRSRSLSWRDQFLAMAFAQLTYRESLRESRLACGPLVAGFTTWASAARSLRSTLGDANESRDWRIYADFAQTLIAIARPLYAHDPIGVELNQGLYALDSTTIDLCLSLIPWAKFRQHKAAVKMQTLLDLHGNIPTFIGITDEQNQRRGYSRRVHSGSGVLWVNGPRVLRLNASSCSPSPSPSSSCTQKKMSYSSAVTLTRWVSHPLGSYHHPDNHRIDESLP